MHAGPLRPFRGPSAGRTVNFSLLITRLGPFLLTFAVLEDEPVSPGFAFSHPASSSLACDPSSPPSPPVLCGFPAPSWAIFSFSFVFIHLQPFANPPAPTISYLPIFRPRLLSACSLCTCILPSDSSILTISLLPLAFFPLSPTILHFICHRHFFSFVITRR